MNIIVVQKCKLEKYFTVVNVEIQVLIMYIDNRDRRSILKYPLRTSHLSLLAIVAKLDFK